MTNRVLILQDSLDFKNIIMVWLALMFLTTVLVIPSAMIRNALKKQPENT